MTDGSNIPRRSLIAGGVAAVAGTGLAAQASATTLPPNELKGYSLPLSAKGEANIVGAPPWNYVGDLVGVEF